MASAETIALRNGINLATHLGVLRIDAESDCELVIDAVKDPYRFNGSQAMFKKSLTGSCSVSLGVAINR